MPLPRPTFARRAALAACLLVSLPLAAQTTGVTSGQKAPRLVIRGATMVDGNGTPARGPVDIVIENGLITSVVTLDAVALRGGGGRRPAGDVQIDAAGKFVLPGLINAHTHMQSNRSGQSMGGFEYYLLLQLANGVTALREVGAENELQSIKMRDQQARGELVGPRMLIYPMFGNARIRTPADARARVQELKRIGADGIKILGLDRDIMQAMLDEAKQVGLPVAHHVGVEETNAWDDIAFGTRSIEHWYGIPDAAIRDGRQHFPSDYNYLDETDRFRWAGRLWREADPARLDSVLASMVRANVAWVPTLDIYEASRDLQRAQTQPWFQDYLHPSLANYFKPDPANHGSYFIGWSSTDEVFWKENYRIWMAALRDFERKGGLVGCGDDAGFIYQMYGYGLIREMELHAEAGFHPLKVIQHCTGNNAKILGLEDKIGRVRAGFAADLIIVDGNPLEDLKTLYPTHQVQLKDGKEARAGLEWTIAGGVPYHVPTVSARIKQIVDSAKGK